MTNYVKKHASAMTEVTNDDNSRKRTIKAPRHDLFKSFSFYKISNSDLVYFPLTILNLVCMQSTCQLVVEVNYSDCCRTT